jgi:hypothetical protein
MLTIRKEQMLQLREACRESAITERVALITRRIRQADHAVFGTSSTTEVAALVREALVAALRYDISDFYDQCQWVHLRLVGGVRFWNEAGFRYFLDEPLFRPETKVRNLVISYSLAARAAGKDE